MQYAKNTEVPILQFEIFERHANRLLHGISTRVGGVSEGHLESLNLGIQLCDSEGALAENYGRFCGAVGVDEAVLVLALQDHTDQVMIVDGPGGGFREPFKSVDGFMTNVAGVPLSVRFADCQGVVMFEPVAGVITAVHCGWRGNAKNILGKTVAKMVEEFGADPGEILVGVSPSLGPCHAEFTEPLRELPIEMHRFLRGNFVDLWECSKVQLCEAGVAENNIETARGCTVCENEEFFSYRGGRKLTGHMGAIIQLK